VKYEIKEYRHLFHMPGFSEAMIKDHLTLYAGYVANTNKGLDAIAAWQRDGKSAADELAEVRRRFGWEWNGMRLHELYFENLGGSGKLDVSSPVARAITQQYGSVAAWERDFRAAGATRGIGWVVLYRDPATGLLIDSWINEHDVAHLAGARPLLVMDVFEHAYLLDYRLKREEYIDAFLQNVRWEEVARRFEDPIFGTIR
jgi:superoxide dismutase, Fe-Mn family